MYRVGHKNTKFINDVAEIQEGCHIPKYQVHVGEGHSGGSGTFSVCFVFLGALGLHCYRYKQYCMACNKQNTVIMTLVTILFNIHCISEILHILSTLFNEDW